MLRTLIPFLLSILITCSAFGQEDIRNVYFDTLKTGDVQPQPIGIDEMRYVGTQYISGDDSALMRYTQMTIQRDIDFSADFSLVQLDSFYLKTYEIEEVDLLGWKRLGADLVVKLEAEFPGKNLRVSWRLYYANTRQLIARGRLEYDRKFWRELGHDISNDIVYNLTGDRGVFRTKIAFIRKVGKAKELYIADYDGANEKKLTSSGSTNLSPEFTPDGRYIFFISYRDGNPQLYRAEVKTGAIARITSFPGMVVAPAISPDGDKIACILTKDGNSELYLLDIRGKVLKRLTYTRAIESSPTWSPDSRLIAFSSDRSGSPQIYVMDAFGLNVRRLTYEGRYNDSPVWSRRGTRITFVSRTKYGRFDLASIDTSGTDYRVLTEVGRNENPHFSPDGKHLIFSSTRLGSRDLFTMDYSGRNQRRLTRVGRCSNPNWGPLAK